MREKIKEKHKTITIYLRVSEQQLKALDIMASNNYRSRCDEIRKIIDDYINKEQI